MFIEPDFNRRSRIDRLAELPFLLGRCLRIHTTTAANGTTLPVDARADEARADRLAALTRSALEGNIHARPLQPLCLSLFKWGSESRDKLLSAAKSMDPGPGR